MPVDGVRTLVLVTGLPGSGKSTLARQLAAALDLPLIAKDRYKELLFDTLGPGDADWSRRVGQAAIALQYEVMATIKAAVVDSALWTDASEPEIEALGLPLVQVYCRCPFDLARQRFFDRLAAGERHPGYREETMSSEDFDRFLPLVQPLHLRSPLVEVDTSQPVDAAGLAARLAARARSEDRL